MSIWVFQKIQFKISCPDYLKVIKFQCLDAEGVTQISELKFCITVNDYARAT